MAASLCGGIGSGPIATGSSASGSTLTLTMLRDLTCDSILYAVYGLGYFHASTFDTGNQIQVGTDTFGHTWTCSTATKSLIGLIRQNHVLSGADQSSILMGTCLVSAAAGSLLTGDTITFTITTSHPSVLESVGMAFAITGINDTALKQWSFGDAPPSAPTLDYADGDQYTDNSPPSTSTTLNWLTDYGYKPACESDAVLLTGALSWPPSGTYTPAAATKLGQYSSTNMTVALSMFPSVVAQVESEPGGSWASAATSHVGNYQYSGLTAVPTGPTLRGKYRATQ